MLKSKILHIVIVIFGMLSSGFSMQALVYPTPQTLKDSVYIDTAPIEKREFGNLKDKYTDDVFIYERTVETSGWWTRFKQWLADLFFDLFSMKSDASASNLVSIVIHAFVIIIFLAAVFFIFKAILNKDGKWIFGKSSDKSIIPVIDLERNIHETDFKSLIHSAEKEQNYRLAIRYYYLWLLKRMSQAEIIDYDVEKTNSDYYYEIKANATKEDFSYTSYLYNYIWYGEFDIDQTQFDKAKLAFTQFLNTIKI